jgi:hypothetical protein
MGKFRQPQLSSSANMIRLSALSSTALSKVLCLELVLLPSHRSLSRPISISMLVMDHQDAQCHPPAIRAADLCLLLAAVTALP